VSGTVTYRRLVRDLANKRVGEVMAKNITGSRLYLRPVGGGIEWEVAVDEVEDVVPLPDCGDAA